MNRRHVLYHVHAYLLNGKHYESSNIHQSIQVCVLTVLILYSRNECLNVILTNVLVNIPQDKKSISSATCYERQTKREG